MELASIALYAVFVLVALAAIIGILPAIYLPLVYRNVAGKLTAARLLLSSTVFVGTCSLLIVASITVSGPNPASAESSGRLTQTEAQGMRSSGVILSSHPQVIEHGRQLSQDLNCRACHTIIGQGGAVGPDLSHVSSRRTPEWILQHFRDPQEVSPGTLMPKFNLPDSEYLALTEYLYSLPK